MKAAWFAGGVVAALALVATGAVIFWLYDFDNQDAT